MEKRLKLDTQYLEGFVSSGDLEGIFPEVEKAHAFLAKRNGPGKEFLGWMDIPENIDEELVEDIEKTAADLNHISDAIIIIGIGGSYLGARSIHECLTPKMADTKIFFAGCDLSVITSSTFLRR